MKREQLEALELSKESIDAVMKIYGEDVNALKAAHDTALEAVKGDTKTIQDQLDAANKQIAEFEKLDAVGLKAKIEEWKGKAEKFEQDLTAAQTAREQEVAQIKFDHVLEAALKDAKVIDPGDVIHRLDRDVLKVSDDGKSVIGLEEQLKPIKENKPYLFDDSEEGQPRFSSRTNSNNVGTDAFEAAMRKGAGLDPKE